MQFLRSNTRLSCVGYPYMNCVKNMPQNKHKKIMNIKIKYTTNNELFYSKIAKYYVFFVTLTILSIASLTLWEYRQVNPFFKCKQQFSDNSTNLFKSASVLISKITIMSII